MAGVGIPGADVAGVGIEGTAGMGGVDPGVGIAGIATATTPGLSAAYGGGA